MPIVLRIRKEQMTALEVSVIREANVRLAQYARTRFPEQFRDKPQEDLIDLAAAVRDRARPYGITTENDLATALDLTVMYGPDFYNSEWAHDVFTVTDWDGAHKLEVVRARVRSQVPDF